MLDKVAEGGSVESLAQAIANDSRALRHGLLIADMGRDASFEKACMVNAYSTGLSRFSFSHSPVCHRPSLQRRRVLHAMVRVLRVMLEEGAGRIKDGSNRSESNCRTM